MRRFLTFFFMATTAVSVMVAGAALDGRWRGELQLGQRVLPLVFEFSHDDEGKLKATMDSPLQNAKGLPLTVVFESGDSLNVECKPIGARYTAKVLQESIEGTFSQMGYKFPLSLKPELSEAQRRPQTPKAPFPYSTVDTAFTSFDGTILAGTLTVPDLGKGKKCPVVVMVTGSGAQNRDEEIFEHKPFAVIADYLARQGIATFRYDDRGFGKSGGDFISSTIETFKNDAGSAVNLVKSTGQFSKAGVLGHSEGGTVAIVLAGEKIPDFIVTLAAMAVPGKQTLLKQNRHLLERNGISKDECDAFMKVAEKYFDEIARQANAGISEPIDIDKLCEDEGVTMPAPLLESWRQSAAARSPYMDSLTSVDPTNSLRKINCPFLAINGTKDTQVNVDDNLGAIASAVKKAQILRMDGLNHLMQHASTGDVSEYGEISETISPEVLEIIAEFISEQ